MSPALEPVELPELAQIPAHIAGGRYVEEQVGVGLGRPVEPFGEVADREVETLARLVAAYGADHEPRARLGREVLERRVGLLRAGSA